jgi:hypothetical protein
MQNPTDQAEASIPAETVREGPNLNQNRTVTVRRKAAKRSTPLPQAEAIPARKKPRLEEPLPTTTTTSTTDEVDRETAVPDVSVGPPPDADNDDANSDPLTETQPHPGVPGVPGATGRWTLEQDADLTNAVITNTWGEKHRTDWFAVVALVPGRTQKQCFDRWRYALDPSIFQSNERMGKWTEDEILKLKNSVHMHGGKNWAAIASLVPGRTQKQCCNRWQKILKPSIALTAGRKGTWTEDENLKLKNSVHIHGGKDWAAIASLVPGRTQKQCFDRWLHVLDPSIARCTGKWTEDEDLKLKNSVHMHGGKDWAAITSLVPGRTKTQCRNRWQDMLDLSIALTAGRTGKWTEDEDLKLKNAMQMQMQMQMKSGKDWVAIAALVPGRTKSQCRNRWRKLP